MRFLIFLWFLLCLACLTSPAQVRPAKAPARDSVFREGYIRLPVRLNCKGHDIYWIPVTEKYSPDAENAGG